MADYADKTEAPTQHRRAEARRAGDVARSPELVAALICLGAVLLVKQFGNSTVDAFAILIKDGLGATSSTSAGKVGYLVGSALGPVLGGIVLIATAAHLAQGGFAFRLRLRGISPAKNVSEMFGGRGATQLAVSVAKLALVGVVTYVAARGRVGEIVAMQGEATLDIAKACGAVLFAVSVRVGVALLVVGVIDYAWRRWRHERSLRMTRREVKDEQRRLEGSPETKRRRRQGVADMASARLDRQVGSADVIVTGRDVAVAVAFDPATMVAPRVIARGKSAAAKAICEKADEKNVATVERDALAGELFGAVAVGHDVPERFFSAVADVIAYARQLEPRRRDS